MNKENIWEDVLSGMEEAVKIARGKAKPVSVAEVFPEPKAVRKKLKLSQPQFAALVGVNTYTLRNWEQGKRRVPRVARTLLMIADEYPEVVLAVRRKALA